METDTAPAPPAGRAGVYHLAEGTELLGQYQDSAFEEPRYLVARADGQVMQLPGLLYQVVASLDGRDAAGIAAELKAHLGDDLEEDVTDEDVAFVIEERLRPVGLLAPGATQTSTTVPGKTAPGATAPGEDTTPPAPVRADPLLALRYRAGVIPASVASRIAGCLGPLFARPVWPLLLAAFVGVDAWIVLRGDLVHQATVGIQSMVRTPALVFAFVGLTVASGAFHEWGHITACRYGGARPGDVGIGIYIVWPAFYSTVTDSYRLDRRSRLRTDLGGLYFDALFMAVAGAVYLHTGLPWLLVAMVGLHAEMAWQLLPSVRLDGYYILADLIGVPDLFGYVRAALVSLVPGRPVHPKIRGLRPRARRLVTAWVAIVVPVLVAWAAGFAVAAPAVIRGLVGSFDQYLAQLSASSRAADVVGTAVGVLWLGVTVLPWLGLGLLVWSAAVMVVRLVAVRTGLAGRLSVPFRAAVRRVAGVLLGAAVAAGLVLRILRVAATHPAAPGEQQLAAAAYARLHGLPGGPATPPEETFARAQLTWYARLTDAFSRQASVAAAGRELAVVATAVLAVCLLALVARGRLRAVAVILPLTAVVVMGPAVTVLATFSPALLGAAWVAVGLTVLLSSTGRTAALVGALAVGAGVTTSALLAVPVAVVCAALLGGRAVARSRPRHASPKIPGAVDGGRWLLALLVLPMAGLASFRSAGAAPLLDSSDRTVLLACAALTVLAAAGLRGLRVAAAAGVAVLLAALMPWPGSAQAMVLVVLAAAVVAALLIDLLVRRPVPERPHPLIRAAVVVPALVLVVVGGLFLPPTSPVRPHQALAGWITGPQAAGGTVAVPENLWGDLVRDGVPAGRLRMAGTPGAAGAAWTVQPGLGIGGTPPTATFGHGALELAVHTSPAARIHQAAQAERRLQDDPARGDLHTNAQTLGALLVASSRVTGSADVVAAVARGELDSRALTLLGLLAASHQVGLGPFPAVGQPGPPSALLISTLDHIPASWASAASVITAAAQAQAATAGARITSIAAGTMVAWVHATS